MSRTVLGLGLLGIASVVGAACGGNMQSSDTLSRDAQPDAGAQVSPGSDGGAQVSPGSDGGMISATPSACGLPSVPQDLCGALPTGKVTPCSVNSSGQPSQTGYLEIDSADNAPMYACATSWSPNPADGYIFGQPGTFMSQAQSCCGGAVSATAAPMVPQSAIGSLGTPHIPSHIKPQETEKSGSGALLQDPFAVVVTDTKSGAAATAAIATWLSWGGDGQPHPAPDGTRAYYFAAGFPVNYVILETSEGVPVIVIGPEVSQASDGSTPIGHPTLGVCPSGGGAPLAMTGGEVHGTTINNHSGRYDYGPSATAQTLDNAAKLFNCMGIQITGTTFTAPKP